MLVVGVLDGIDNVIGLYVMSIMLMGLIVYYLNVMQIGWVNFMVIFMGKGGYVLMFYFLNDVIVVGSYFVIVL